MILLVWSLMLMCWTGPEGRTTPGTPSICAGVDLDDNGTIDLADFAELSNTLERCE